LYQFHDIGAGAGGGAATLRFGSAQRRARIVPPVQTGLGARIARLNLVQDLGDRIGSRDWFRGLGTCAALCFAASSFAPGLETVAGATPPPLADAQWEEARALSIAPLALGADTGRRVAASDVVIPLTDAPERPIIDLLAAIGRGDGFARVLERAGIAGAEAAEIERLVAGAVPLEQIKPGTVIDVTLGRRPDQTVARPVERLAFRARLDLRLEIQRVGGRLMMIRTPISIDDSPLRIQGRVGTSLYRSARAAGAPPKAVEAYIRAVATQLNIGALDPGDRFDIIVEHRRAANGDTESGRLLYAGLDRTSGKSLQLMQWSQSGRSQWFEASGVGRQSGSLQRPVQGEVSSGFGMRRHPILGFARMHNGMDFSAGYGTPILAATEGHVSAAGWAGGYGKQVRIAHAGGLTTTYSHMSRMVAQPGMAVRQGQLIGYVGSTGLSTGPHLHYELHLNGAPINPASVRFTTRALLEGHELAAFRERLGSLLSIQAGAPKAKNEALAQNAPRTSAPGFRGF